MPFATNIPILQAPWQGGSAGFEFYNQMIAAATNMQFVNDGYTVLYVYAATVTGQTVTIYSVADNAGRLQDITTAPVTAQAGPIPDMYAFGPFRPIWWNQAGVVNLTFSAVVSLKVAAVSYAN